jgi:hypothetical protein
MDIRDRWYRLKYKYYHILGYNIWELVGKNFKVGITERDTYYERYEKLKVVKKQLEDGFEKMIEDGKIKREDFDENGRYIGGQT